MGDVEAVVRAKEVDLVSAVVEKSMGRVESRSWDYRLSMYADLDRGGPLELAAINGAVVRMGQPYGLESKELRFGPLT